MNALMWELDLRETLDILHEHEKEPESRFKFGSPCRWIKPIDVFIHIIVPEWLELHTPRLSRMLRDTSPRWGRSWRHCQTTQNT